MESQKNNELVAYIVVCWNNADIISECIQSINSQDYPHKKIIVVDNGSTDNSVNLVMSKYPDVEIIQTGNNNGFAIANNIGIEAGLKDPYCRYFALINTDARIRDNWTSTLVGFTKKNKKAACLQTPTLDYYDHSVYDSFGITVDHLGRAVQIGHRSTSAPAMSQRVFGVNFAAAMITRDFIEAQPFEDFLDEDLWMYLEDVDFAARATVLGWENWLVVGSEAYHMGSASSGKNPGFSVYMSYRNNLYMIVKNFPFPIILKLFLGSIVADIISYYQLARGRNKLAIKAIIRGRFTSLTHLSTYIHKRRKVLKIRKISQKELWDLMDPKNFSMNDSDK